MAECGTRQKNLQAALEKEKEKSAEIEGKLSRLKKESDVEMIARARLGFVKQGEVLYKIVGRR